MSSIVTAVAENVAQSIVDYTVAPIARQVGYMLFYEKNVKNLKDQVEKLKGVTDTISHEVEAERRNGHQIYDATQNWLNRVDEIIEAAEKLCDDPRNRNVGCCKGPFLDFKSRHQLSRNAKKFAGTIVEVMQDKNNIGPLTFLPGLESIGFAFGTSSEKLESRKKLKEEIVLALRDPNFRRIGVYGLGGVGKTTLVAEIGKQVKDDKLFDEVVMVNISQDVDLDRIQREIADLLGLHFGEASTVGRGKRLGERIKNVKSILVILDDIWTMLELEKLGILMNDHNGCKLLLTSRNLAVLQKMDTQKDFLVGVLNEDEAWSLFENMVGDVVKDASLREVAIQVAKKCAGLIVLIVTVARALKNKDNIDSWIDALNQLNTADKGEIKEKIYSVLEFSYNHLEGDEVKALFLLMGLLRSQTSVEYLLNLVVGLGLFKQTYTPKDARLKFNRLIDSLKASCLLLENNSNERFKMHDIVNEVAISIALRDQHACRIGTSDELWPSEGILQRCTQIILDCHIPKLPERLECPNMKLFCLYNSNESLSIPDTFFEGMKNLKVLDLTKMHLPSLPQSFHSLIDLQTLCLDQCVIGDMNNIGALVNLQILSLYGSSIIMLHSEVGQLTNLRMLNMTNAGIEIFPCNIVSKLTKLEELYLGNTCINWDQEDSVEENKNASLTELRHLKNLTALEIQIKGAWIFPWDITFEKLQRYKIVIGDVCEWSDNYGASKILKLKLDTVINLYGIKELIEGVEDLYLGEVGGISNALYDLNGEEFRLLRHLHIQNNGKIHHIINSMERKPSHVFFPKLETLILQNLKTLEKICHGSFMNKSFAKLRLIKVKCCDQLKYLFSLVMVKALCQLTEIEVLECSSMKTILSVGDSLPNSVAVEENIEFSSLQSLTLQHLPAIEDFYSGLLSSTTTKHSSSLRDTYTPSSLFNSKVKFSNLERLKLNSIHLENIWQDDQLSVANSFHKLAKLIVEKCNKLKYLFSSFVVGSFPNLKEIEIRECEMMEQIIDTQAINNDAAIQEVGLLKLETIIISNMKRLKKVWHSQFDGLKTMEVDNCEKLENIFSYNVHTTFGRMETLKVTDCGSLKEIFKLPSNEEYTRTQVTQFKKLHLVRLLKLKKIWSKDPQENFIFHNLQDVYVKECENLEHLFPFSIALGLHQLEKLQLDSCGMNAIVAKKEGLAKEKAIFYFDRLYSLKIWSMPQLDRFYAGSHSLTCPSLRMLWVFNCAKLKLLRRQSTHRNPDMSTQQPPFIIEEVIPKLELWELNNNEAKMILQDPLWKDCYLTKLNVLRLSYFEDKEAANFLDSIVQKAPNFKTLVVQHSSLKEIFRDQRVSYKEGMDKINIQLEFLRLGNLQLQHICREGCQIDPILKVLEVLCVTECNNLKNLVPSSVTFSHLTYLEIDKCNGLINLIYSSTAASLVNLQSISIKECNSLEEIVTQGMNETRDEIVFQSLRTLKMESLSRLNSFTSSQCFLRFPLLKDVVVRHCPKIKTFSERATSTPMLRKVTIKEGEDEEWMWEDDLNKTIKKIYVDKIAFHNMEHLDLSLFPELRDSWNNPIGNKVFCNVKSLVVEHCDFLSDVLVPSNLLQALENLEEIQVRDCDSLEVVFELEKEAIHLRKICLSNLPKLRSIWKPNLPEEDEVQIQHQQPLPFIAKVHLHKLKTVIIEDMENLETIWHPMLSPNSMGSFETLKVKKCQKIKQIFPVYMHGSFATLETLAVQDCDLVQEIFQLDVSEMHSEDNTTRLKNIIILQLPKLNQIWSRDPPSSLCYKSLQVVWVEDCEELEYLFPFSIAKNLPLLETITIKNAERMKEIVSKRKEPLDNPVKFEFSQLNSMVLCNLQNLQGFCAGNHTLSCSMIKKLDVFKCMKMKLFNTQGTRITSSPGRVSDGSGLQVSMQHPLFTLKEVIQNLEFLSANHEEASMIIQSSQVPEDQFRKLNFLRLYNLQDAEATSPYWFLQNVTSLQWLVIQGSCFKTIFPDERPRDENGEIEIKTRLKILTLHKLYELQYICKEQCQLDTVLEVLEYLYVDECSALKNLAPSSVTFNHLTCLAVTNCKGLIYLITSSTAKSLVKLTTLRIKECYLVEKIVKQEVGENINEITFDSLEVMELNSLSKLHMFCSSNCLLKFPVLEKLVIRQCPRMTSLSAGETSAPLLQKIVTDEEDEIWCWEGDLTRTVSKMFQDMKIEGVDEIVDSRKQEMQKVLNIPPTGADTPKICEIGETSQKQSGQSTLSLIKAYAEKKDSDGRNNQEKALVPVDQKVLSPAMVDNIVIYPSSSQALETVTSSSIQVGGTKSQKICEISETSPNQTSQNTSSLDKVDADETIETTLVQVAHQGITSSSIVEEPEKLDSESKNQEITYKVLDPVAQDALISVARPMVQSTKIDCGAIGTEEMNETPFSKAVDTLTHTSIQKTALGKEDEASIVAETGKFHSEITNQETKYEVLDPTAQNVPISVEMQLVQSTKIDGEDTVTTEEMHEDRLPPSLEVQGIAAGTHVRHDSVQASSNATPSSTTRESEIDNKEGENDGTSNLKAQIESMKKELLASMQESLALILRDKAQGSMISSSSEVQVHETIQKPLVQNVEQVLIPASPVQDKESHVSDVHLSKNLLNHTCGNNETVGTQETYEFKRRSSFPDAQNILSPTTIYNTGKSSHDPEVISENLSCQVTNSEIDENKANIDPSPSKASSSSTTPISDFCSSFKDLDISIQLLPYLEIGLKQHPQILDWLNSKRRRVSVFSYFSLFAEVTRILKTTRKGHFTEEDQNYIKECCGVLQGVGFDESWISYVHGYIEDGEDLNKRIKEAEDEASNLKAQIDSMKKEIALLRDKKAQGSAISSSRQVLGFSWRSTCKNLCISITIYLLMCVLIYGLSKLPF